VKNLLLGRRVLLGEGRLLNRRFFAVAQNDMGRGLSS